MEGKEVRYAAAFGPLAHFVPLQILMIKHVLQHCSIKDMMGNGQGGTSSKRVPNQGPWNKNTAWTSLAKEAPAPAKKKGPAPRFDSLSWIWLKAFPQDILQDLPRRGGSAERHRHPSHVANTAVSNPFILTRGLRKERQASGSKTVKKCGDCRMSKNKPEFGLGAMVCR